MYSSFFFKLLKPKNVKNIFKKSLFLVCIRLIKLISFLYSLFESIFLQIFDYIIEETSVFVLYA